MVCWWAISLTNTFCLMHLQYVWYIFSLFDTSTYCLIPQHPVCCHDITFDVSSFRLMHKSLFDAANLTLWLMQLAIFWLILTICLIRQTEIACLKNISGWHRYYLSTLFLRVKMKFMSEFSLEICASIKFSIWSSILESTCWSLTYFNNS